MAFVIGLLTVIMVLDCALLIFLVLIQLPKKEAGAGLAFGGGASDALFGAGSGNVLTKVTKYSAIAFFVLALFISALFNKYHNQTKSEFEQNLQKTPAMSLPTTPAQPAAPATTPAPAPATAPAAPAAPTTAPVAPASNK